MDLKALPSFFHQHIHTHKHTQMKQFSALLRDVTDTLKATQESLISQKNIPERLISPVKLAIGMLLFIMPALIEHRLCAVPGFLNPCFQSPHMWPQPVSMSLPRGELPGSSNAQFSATPENCATTSRSSVSSLPEDQVHWSRAGGKRL